MHGTDVPEVPVEPGVAGSSAGFEVVRHTSSRSSRLVLRGELDQSTRSILDAAVAAALREGPPVLLLDLFGLDFLAVAGAHAFEDAQERCGRDGGRIALLSPVRPVRRLLTLFDLGHLVVDR